jgi:hypothetical protein
VERHPACDSGGLGPPQGEVPWEMRRVPV